MNTWETVYFILTTFARLLPQFIVLGFGIFLCFSNRAKYPRAAKTALGGLIILLITTLLGFIANILTVYSTVWFRASFNAVSYVSFAVSILLSVISAVGLGLLIYAVWAERERK